MSAIAASIGIASIATSVVLAKQAGDAAKKAGRTMRENQLADQAAYDAQQVAAKAEAELAERRARRQQDNEDFLQQIQYQLSMRSGVAGENSNPAAVSSENILPIALGTAAVGVAVILLARRKK